MSWEQTPSYDLLDKSATEDEFRQDMPLVPHDRGPVATFDIREFLAIGSAAGARDDVAMLKAAKRLGTALGGRAYYSWKQSDGLVEGPTVHAMDGLAKIYGHLWRRCAIDAAASTPDRVALIVQVIDMRAIDISERPAVAHISPAPGKYAAKDEGRARWYTMQLQAGISKAMRNGLQHAIPKYLQDAVVGAAKAAEREMAGRDVARGREQAVAAFERRGVSRERLEQHMGSTADRWGVEELVALRGLHSAMEEGQIDAGSIGQQQSSRPDGDGIGGGAK